MNKILERGQEGLADLLNQRTNVQKEKDIFELPSIKKDEDDVSDSDDSGEERENVLKRLNIHHTTDIHNVDVNSAAFTNLPKRTQVEVLMELREKRKMNSWAKLDQMPKVATDFSSFQFERLLKRRSQQAKLDDVGKALSEESFLSVDDSKLFVGDKVGIKRQKLEEKLKKGEALAGKDFIFLKKVREREEEKKQVKDEPVAGPSNEIRELNDEPNFDYLESCDDIDEETAKNLAKDNDVSQEEIMALFNNKRRAQNKAPRIGEPELSSGNEDEIGAKSSESDVYWF